MTTQYSVIRWSIIKTEHSTCTVQCPCNVLQSTVQARVFTYSYT